MIDILHHAGHKYLKVLFVLALAGSSALFFSGAAITAPPIVVVIIGTTLGIALEWAYFVFSCDLTEAITEGNRTGIFVNLSTPSPVARPAGSFSRTLPCMSDGRRWITCSASRASSGRWRWPR